jgi:tetratricopeptide (TPR) repeat protein
MVTGKQTKPVTTGPDRQSRRFVPVAIALVVGLGLALFALKPHWFGVGVVNSPSREASLAAALVHLERQEYSSLLQISQQLSAKSPGDNQANLLLARAAIELGQPTLAIDALSLVPLTNQPEALSAKLKLAELQAAAHRYDAAEQTFRSILAIGSEQTAIVERLGQVLAIQGRQFEARPYLLKALTQPQFSWPQLLAAAAPETLLNESMQTSITQWNEVAALDSRSHLARSILLAQKEKFAEAITSLQRAKQLDPPLAEVDARLGQLLYDHRTNADLFTWTEQLAPNSNSHPLVWSVLGQWAERSGDRPAALRCFLEAAKLDPQSRLACYRAGQLATRLDQQRQGESLLARARLLEQLQTVHEKLLSSPGEFKLLAEAADLSEQLGRYLEAAGWLAFWQFQDRTQTALGSRIAKLRQQGLSLSDVNIVESNFRDRWPLPVVKSYMNQTPLASPPVQLAPSVAAQVKLTDVAAEVGLNFKYDNDHDPSKVVMRSHEASGGGIAILDYDRDGWPDVYATQGGPWPDQTSRPLVLDELFRNREGTFLAIAQQAGILEAGYGQGAAAGDFNNDGFPDLYVANAGTNSFFINQGDGTFTEQALAAGVAGNEWTSSAAFADLNADGLPDLVTTGYMGGSDVFTRYCVDEKGIQRSCKPRVYPAAPDCCYVNTGDGRFTPIPEADFPQQDNGRGFGLVVADFSGNGQRQVFVANDSEANFFFEPTNAGDNGPIKFAETALSAGLAFNADGKPQACMGVAAADVDHNGLLDLLVTNYYHEGSTLYLQEEPLTFVDRSHDTGIFELSFPYLGFGTQFFDPNLDGTWDLIAANGHEGDYSDLGVPHRMPAQLLLGSPEGKFTEANPDHVGPYFKQVSLGRAVALLDYNRDGLEDALIGHLDQPVALLKNETDQPGHGLVLELVGTIRDRDAIGSLVEVHAGNRVLHHQLIAGGYQASHQKHLVIGVGAADQIDRLIIHWPSGLQQEFANLPVRKAFMAVEGQPRIIKLSSMQE